MLVLLSVFIETFLISIVVLFLDCALTMSSIWIAFSISILVTVILMRACLLHHYSETMLLQSFVYKKIIHNFFISFFRNIFYAIKVSLTKVKSSVVVDGMEIDDNNWDENAIACNCINISSDTIVSLLDNKNIKIHSINSNKYMRNVIADSFVNLHSKMYDEELF